MFKKLLQNKRKKTRFSNGAEFLLRQSNSYLLELQTTLDTHLDKRLVRTFFDLFVTILTLRDRANGLLLSELEGYICSFDNALFGSKFGMPPVCLFYNYRKIINCC